jgi:hypothetical protein
VTAADVVAGTPVSRQDEPIVVEARTVDIVGEARNLARSASFTASFATSD